MSVLGFTYLYASCGPTSNKSLHQTCFDIKHTFSCSLVCVFGYKLHVCCRWISSGSFTLHLADVFLLAMVGEKKAYFYNSSIFLSHVSYLLLSLSHIQHDG